MNQHLLGDLWYPATLADPLGVVFAQVGGAVPRVMPSSAVVDASNGENQTIQTTMYLCILRTGV